MDGVFAGIGPELNGYTRGGIATGGGLELGLDIDRCFAAGMKTAFFHNLDTVSTLEPQVFFRYYLPWLHWPKETDGPFAQAELGGVVFFEYGEAFPSFSGSLAVGWRFGFGKNLYAEPALRLGSPPIWGVNLTAGIRLQVKKQETAVFEEKAAIPVEVLVVPDGDTLRIYTPPIIFRADHANFEGLSDEVLDGNTRTLTHIVDLLNTFGDYRIEVEGYANPTTPEGPERAREEPALMRLSEERAQAVVEELARLGAEPGRLSYRGAGGSRTAVPFNARDTNWQNRRVEFILIRQPEHMENTEENDEEEAIGNE